MLVLVVDAQHGDGSKEWFAVLHAGDHYRVPQRIKPGSVQRPCQLLIASEPILEVLMLSNQLGLCW